MAAAGLLALLGLHAAVSISVHDGLLIPFLAQGSMKLAAFITLTSLIVVLFQSEESRQPPFPATAAVFVAASVFLVILQLLLQRGHIGSFIPLTNLLSGLVGILFLLAVSAYQDGRNTSRLLAGLAAIVALSISILFQNKGFILVAICFLIVVAFAWRGTRLERYTYGWRLAGALLVVFAVASAVVAAMQQLDLMPVSTDTIGRSLSIRGTLWSHAITVGSAAFPLRIGAGQFAATAGSIPILASEAHEVVHTTALTWFAELGLLGLSLAIGTVALVWRAVISWPGSLRLMFVIYLAVPFILHDGHGVRMVMLILALGIANAIYRDEPTAQQTP